MGQPKGGKAVLAACAVLHPLQQLMVGDLSTRLASVCRPGLRLSEPGGGLQEVSRWTAVANSLTECGLMALIPEGQCRVPERAGAFGVPKKGPNEPARVIIDRRPRNAVEKDFSDVLQSECDKRGLSHSDAMALRRLLLLPHISQLVDVICPHDAQIVTSCEDARDYFYLLKAPWARVEETLVGFAIPAQLLSAKARANGGIADDHTGRVVLALKAPAMGDKKSVELAQIVHHWSLLRSRALTPSSWLSFGYPCPGGTHLCGAYVDDLGLVSLVSPSYDKSKGVDTRAEHHDLVMRARAGYLVTGIERKPEKAKQALTESTLWGAELSSK
eukprot:4785748-Amphidinium_carterae.1